MSGLIREDRTGQDIYITSKVLDSNTYSYLPAGSIFKRRHAIIYLLPGTRYLFLLSLSSFSKMNKGQNRERTSLTTKLPRPSSPSYDIPWYHISILILII